MEILGACRFKRSRGKGATGAVEAEEDLTRAVRCTSATERGKDEKQSNTMSI